MQRLRPLRLLRLAIACPPLDGLLQLPNQSLRRCDRQPVAGTICAMRITFVEYIPVNFFLPELALAGVDLHVISLQERYARRSATLALVRAQSNEDVIVPCPHQMPSI